MGTIRVNRRASAVPNWHNLTMAFRVIPRVRASGFLVSAFQLIVCLQVAWAQKQVPPYDLWNDSVLASIRDRSTLEESISAHLGYYDVFFTSNPAADWYEAEPPYNAHRGEKIRIHGFLAGPPVGGPYPALVVGHGHGGRANRDLTLFIASFGYVVLSIDGPEAGESTGGPEDKNQAWISVDAGPQYGYLYHYAYAGMRALTLLQRLADLPANPLRIDAQKLGVLGASMGGIFTTHINGIDDRVKAAISIASAGNWHHALRYPNSWLYHGIYTGTRDVPYNGSDPLNSIENIDFDPTAVTFINYFDPIRYAPRQRAPILTVIGTHDQYFPLPGANLIEQAIQSARVQPSFEKRLWLIPNAPHILESSAGLQEIAGGLRQWLDYAFGKRQKPLASPSVSLVSSPGGLRFEITLGEPEERLQQARAALHAATRIDSTVTPIRDFREYAASREGNRFVVLFPPGERSPSGDAFTLENSIYFATVTDSEGFPVSSLAYMGRIPMDLSSRFTPVIDHFPGDSIVVPLPPPMAEPAVTLASSVSLPEGSSYQGIALTNSGTERMIARLEGRTPQGRLASGEGLINPVFMALAPRAQQVFLAEEWMGAGIRQLAGVFRVIWSHGPPAALSFRGNVSPPALDGIGPLRPVPGPLWLPLASDIEPGAARLIRIATLSQQEGSPLTLVFRNRFGEVIEMRLGQVPPGGIIDVAPPSQTGLLEPASAEIRSSGALAARLEVSGSRDPWSIEARPMPGSFRFIQPHVEWNGIFTTRLVLLNPTNVTVEASMKLHMTSGASVGSNTLLLVQPGVVTSMSVESLFRIGPSDPRGAGWLEIECNGGPLVVTALALDERSGAAAASAVEAPVSGPWLLPFYVESPGYYTGLALANPAAGATVITMTAYGPEGAVLGQRKMTLPPGESRAALVFQWFTGLSPGSTGHLEIASTSPLALLSYFGTTEGASLAAIPFTVIPP